MLSGGLLPLLLAGGLLASCTQDELLSGSGTPLPEGEYPLQVSAYVVDAVPTRAGGKDSWTGSEEIGVRIGADGKVGKYEITNPGTGAMQPVKEGNVDNTVYWQNTSSATVTAWYPYEPQTDVNISDQSGGYEKFDFLRAETKDVEYNSGSVSLAFYHQMAKVKYTLKKDASITEDEFSKATVTILGDAVTTFKDGVLAVADQKNGEIEPSYDPVNKTGETVVVPQVMDGEQFIRVSIGDDHYYYTPKDGEANLTGGNVYTYNITVKKEEIEVIAVKNGMWTDTPEQGETDHATFRVHISEEPSLSLTLSDNAQKLADGYYEVTGNPLTISYSIPDGGLMKGFSIADGQGESVRTLGDDKKTYTFTYTLHTDVHLQYGSYAEIGDYYYEDNTWLPYLDENKTCVGIVFKNGAGEGDDASLYDGKLSEIHGYAVALHDAEDTDDNNQFMWAQKSILNYCGTSLSRTDYAGYVNTKTIQQLEGYSAGNYPACQAASNFDVTSPNGSSGWYLPSCGQMLDVVNLWRKNTGLLRHRLKTLSGYDKYQHKYLLPSGNYATSTEWNGNEYNAYACRIEPDGRIKNEPKDYSSYGSFTVRPVLTF